MLMICAFHTWACTKSLGSDLEVAIMQVPEVSSERLRVHFGVKLHRRFF